MDIGGFSFRNMAPAARSSTRWLSIEMSHVEHTLGCMFRRTHQSCQKSGCMFDEAHRSVFLSELIARTKIRVRTIRIYHHRQLAIASGAVVIALNSVEHSAQLPSTMSVDEILTSMWAVLSQVYILK